MGMSCSLGKHDDVCEELKREAGLCMTLAHDGLTIGRWHAGPRARPLTRRIVLYIQHHFTKVC